MHSTRRAGVFALRTVTRRGCLLALACATAALAADGRAIAAPPDRGASAALNQSTTHARLKLFLVDDAAARAKMGADSRDYMLNVAGLASLLFGNRLIGPYEVDVSVSGLLDLQGPAPYAFTTTNGVADIVTLLSGFTGFMGNDSASRFAHLDNGDPIAMNILMTGLATSHPDETWLSSVCSPPSSPNNDAVITINGDLQHDTFLFARALGFGLGMTLDTVDINTIMSQSISVGTSPTAFSASSLAQAVSYLNGSNLSGACFNATPGWSSPPGICGDGHIDSGEQCDCGSNDCSQIDPCCNGATCTFNTGATCSSLDGCCPAPACKPSAANTVCRTAAAVCQTNTVCDGIDSTCPEEAPIANGVACNDSFSITDGACFEGSCAAGLAEECAAFGLANGFGPLVACSHPPARCGQLACAPSSSPSSCETFLDQTGKAVAESDGASCGTSSQCVAGACVPSSSIEACLDGSARNACGGCGPVVGGTIGAACGGGLCGTLVCTSANSLGCSGTQVCDPHATCNAASSSCSCNSNYDGSGTICSARTQVNISSSASGSVLYGQPVTYTVQVQNLSGSDVPVGMVSFFDGSTATGPAQVSRLPSSGIVTFTTTSLPAPGTDTVTARFQPDFLNFESSFSSTTQTVLATSTTALTVAPIGSDPSLVQLSSVTTFAPHAPPIFATIFFTDSVSGLLGAVAVSGSGPTYSASLTPRTPLSPGVHQITASYDPGLQLGQASSATVTYAVAIATAVSVISQPQQALYGQPLELDVAVTAGTTPVTSGAVSILDQGAAIATLQLDANGLAAFDLTFADVGVHQLSIAYLGSGAYSASALAYVQQVFPLSFLNLTVNSSPTDPSVLQLSADVLFYPPQTAVTIGQVDFNDSGNDLGAISLAQQPNGDFRGELDTPSLAPGDHFFTATYLGSVDTLPYSTQGTDTFVPEPTTIVLTADPAGGSVPGQPVTFKAAVYGVAGFPFALQGTVGFDDETGTPFELANPVQLQPEDDHWAVSITTTALPAGLRTIRAVHFNEGFALGSTTTIQYPVAQIVTALALTSSANPAPFGQPVQIDVTLNGARTSAALGYTIDGVAGTDALALSPDPAGANSSLATLTLSSLAAGAHAVVVTYAGDLATAGSSAELDQLVSEPGAPTSVSVTSSANPSSFGQAVTLKLFLIGASITDMLSVQIDGGGALSVPIAPHGKGASTGTLKLASNLEAGPHAIAVSYAGTPQIAKSSTVFTQYVGMTASTLAITTSPAAPVFGQDVTVHLKVTASGIGANKPAGLVTLSIDSAAAANLALDATGAASFVTNSLTAGGHVLTASYAGNQDFVPSSAGPVALTIGEAQTTTTLTLSPKAPTAADFTTLTAKVRVKSPGAGVPGLVLFNIDGAITSAALDITGTATLQTALGAGAHTIGASYADDGNLAGSAADSVTIDAPLVTPKVTLKTSAATAAPGLLVTFTATLTPAHAIDPEGSISFFDNGILIATAPVSAGAAAFSSDSLALGVHTIAASYTGDARYAASASNAVKQTIKGRQQ